MTREQALVVRTWRVDLDCSWGRVGELYLSVWGSGDGCNSFSEYGARLCEEAAKLLGEKPGEEPWN